MTLEKSRSDLESINKKILSLFIERREKTSEIQRLKAAMGSDVYDPQRELSLFASLRQALEMLSFKELAAFSLLMESHAGEGYPQWSEGEHLGKGKQGLGVNPLLLLLFYPDKINVMALKDEYKTLLKLLSKPSKLNEETE